MEGFPVLTTEAARGSALEGAVVAIGNFDGVHRGHAALIALALERANAAARPSAVLTFEPHPADAFAGRPVVFRLTPPPAKALVLERRGVDGMFQERFTPELAGLTAQDFVEEILVRRLGVSGVVIGHDFRFGKGRAGTAEFLKDAGARFGFGVSIVNFVPDAAGRPISSTIIRAALESGDIACAQKLLGYPYFMTGPVIGGAKLGRALGFPTANMAPDPSCRLAHGVYAVRARFDGAALRDGVASFGRRPTFDNGAQLLETHLFDYSGDLYGKGLRIDFYGWIRGEEKFSEAEALIARMREDASQARDILARQPPHSERL